MVRGKAHGRIRTLAVVEREREIVDASERRPQVEQEVWGEDVSVTQGILLGHIGRGTVEVGPASANLKTIHGSQTWWSEGANCVVGEACEEQVPAVQLMVDPGVVGVTRLCLVRADREVVRQLADAAD